MEFPKDLMTRWISALRDPARKQTRYQLGRNDAEFGGQCCLGVLCEVAEVDFNPNYSYPPDEVGLWLDGRGLSETGLARMNDGTGASFTEIADYIERTARE